MGKRLPTFRADSELLIGSAAVHAWKTQRVRCNCGAYGDAENSISGTCNDMPAKWLGCDYHPTAVGRPLVYRLQCQIEISAYGS